MDFNWCLEFQHHIYFGDHFVYKKTSILLVINQYTIIIVQK